MDLRHYGDVSNGLGDGLAIAFEMVVTPAIFGVLGYLLDDRLDVVPLFTVLFVLSVLAYEIWRLWCAYDLGMARAEEGKPWTRGRESADA